MTFDSSIKSALARSQENLKKNFERLSSGKRITVASDDPAGVAIARSLEAVSVNLSQANRNAGYGSSAANIATSAIQQVSDISIRLQELATASANGTLSPEQRNALNTEYQQLNEEAQRIAASTEFNGRRILAGEPFTVQVGVDGSAQSQISIGETNIQELVSSIASSTIASVESAQQALGALSDFATGLGASQAELGAAQSRMEVAIANNEAARSNAIAAQSRIEDIDVAEETASFIRNMILQDTSTALLAQSKLISGVALKLLS
jgi:flagellin